MTSNLGPLFDVEEAERLRDHGIANASRPDARKNLLKEVKNIAYMLAVLHGAVTADDVVEWYYETECIRIDKILGNAMGSVFRDKRFRFSGELVPSRRPERRGNMNRIWKPNKRNSS